MNKKYRRDFPYFVLKSGALFFVFHFSSFINKLRSCGRQKGGVTWPGAAATNLSKVTLLSEPVGRVRLQSPPHKLVVQNFRKSDASSDLQRLFPEVKKWLGILLMSWLSVWVCSDLRKRVRGREEVEARRWGTENGLGLEIKIYCPTERGKWRKTSSDWCSRERPWSGPGGGPACSCSFVLSFHTNTESANINLTLELWESGSGEAVLASAKAPAMNSHGEADQSDETLTFYIKMFCIETIIHGSEPEGRHFDHI